MGAFVDQCVLLGSVALVGLTIWEVGRRWCKKHDRYQSDLLLVVAVLAGILLFGRTLGAFSINHPRTGFLINVFFLGQPYMLLRLVRRFRPVPRWFDELSIAWPIGGAGLSVIWPPGSPGLWTALICLFFTGTLAFAAWTFGEGARRAVGVSSQRLWYASVGTWLHVGIAIVVGIEALAPASSAWATPISRLLGLGVFGCYYVGLVGPARWKTARIRRELHLFLEQSAGRSPMDRARHAAGDLHRAARRAVGSACTAVLLVDDRRPSTMVVVAASDAAWDDLVVSPGSGLLAESLETGLARTGPPSACEPALAQRINRQDGTVHVVPIVTDARHWGALVVVERHGTLFPEDDLEILNALCRHTASTLDHGRLVAAEAERLQLAADLAIRDTESRYRVILESLTDYAVVLLDSEGVVVSWSPGATAIFGWRQEEMRGRPAWMIFDQTPDEFRDNLDLALRQKRFATESPCRRREGVTFPASTTIRPVLPEAGGAPMFVLVARDESTRHAIEGRRRQAQKLEAVSQLAGTVAGDFNHLLDVVLRSTPIARASNNRQDELGRDLAEVREAAERTAVLTRQLLTLGHHFEASAASTTIALPDVLSSLQPFLARAVGESIELVIETSPRCPHVNGDAVQIEQIVIDLVLHARDAMPDGGRVAISAEEVVLPSPDAGINLAPGSYAALTVTDTGSGMDTDTKARMFEPSFASRSSTGRAGLGLSLVFSVVTRMGGAIAVESEPGCGATIRVYFPAAVKPSAIRPRAQGTETARRLVRGTGVFSTGFHN